MTNRYQIKHSISIVATIDILLVCILYLTLFCSLISLQTIMPTAAGVDSAHAALYQNAAAQAQLAAYQAADRSATPHAVSPAVNPAAAHGESDE